MSRTVTMTIAQPCVVTDTTHGLSTGARVAFSTSNTLPTGIIPYGTTPYLDYYVNVIDANTYKLAANSLASVTNISTLSVAYTSSTRIFAATAHGLPVGSVVMISGTMPSGLTAGTIYYVIGTNYGANQFSISTTVSGAVVATTTNGSGLNASTLVNTSGSQSGTQTVYDVKAQDNSEIITMTIASPAVVTCFGHAHSVGDPVYFDTNGALPTGVTRLQRYFVISAGFSNINFQFSATKGGSAINTSGSQSGAHFVLGPSVNGALLFANQAVMLSNVLLYVPINLSNVVTGSEVGIYRTDTSEQIALGISKADGTFTALTRFLGNITVRVRNRTAGNYVAFETQAITTVNGVGVFVSQILDTTA